MVRPSQCKAAMLVIHRAQHLLDLMVVHAGPFDRKVHTRLSLRGNAFAEMMNMVQSITKNGTWDETLVRDIFWPILFF